jgi:Phytanoyl-CoA dioxygenase (PhyH)
MHADALSETGWLRVSSTLPNALLANLSVGHALDDQRLGHRNAGSRNLLEQPWCAALVEPIRERLRSLGVLPADAVAVQCTIFRKTPECNWKVPYHQDLSIPVAVRVDAPGLSGWSLKEDGHYVQPDEALLAAMLAVRLHLDPCPAASGALRVVPGSHRLGRIEAERIATIHKQHEVVCDADAGDLLLMRPLLLHASSKARVPNGRRVLHFLFAPSRPGQGLSWRMAV